MQGVRACLVVRGKYPPENNPDLESAKISVNSWDFILDLRTREKFSPGKGQDPSGIPVTKQALKDKLCHYSRSK